MGYPIYTNIFSDNPRDSEELRRFPIQVAVLYSPADKTFANAFREVFLELDQITGDDVVFFAVLDPPDDWLQVARNRTSWREYWEARKLGHSLNDRMLIDEISHQFGIQWEDLPAIVVSTNLWSAEFVTSHTSADHIVSQLKSLTELAKERRNSDNLDLGYILETLQDKFGFSVRYQPPDEGIRRSFSQFYEVLSTTLETGENQIRRVTQYWNDVFFTTVRSVRSAVSKLSESTQISESQKYSGTDALLRGLAGRLVPFVAFSEKTRNRRLASVLRERFDLSRAEEFISEIQFRDDLLDTLDDESFTMINRALRVAAFLDDPESLKPILQGSKNRLTLDEFAPAGQGLWKAFEREINMSVVQAMRNARTIEMPKFFARYRPEFSGRKYIETPRKVDINRQDWEDPLGDRHRLIELGVALNCVNALKGNINEQFDQVIRRCTGISNLPHELLTDWKAIASLRNPSSHTELLSRKGFKEVAGRTLKPGNLEALMTIKKVLSH